MFIDFRERGRERESERGRERAREREAERETEKHPREKETSIGCLVYTPHPGTDTATEVCILTGN